MDDQTLAADVDEAARARSFLESLKLCGAIFERITAGDPQPTPMLAAAVLQGLIRPITMMEGRSRALIALHPSPDVKVIAEQILPRYRAMILAALAAAAEAAGAPDISAPIAAASIHAFICHVDNTWWAFTDPLDEARERFLEKAGFKEAGPEADYWNQMLLHMLGLKEAIFRLRNLVALRVFWRQNPVPVELNAVIGKDIQRVLGMPGVPDNRKITFRSDTEKVTVSADDVWRMSYSAELIRNAVFFSPPETEVRVSLSVEGRTAAFFVDDDGPGLSDSEDAWMQPFARTLTNIPGDIYNCRLGIGLTSVKLLAEKAGWCFEFADGKTGRRPLLLMPIR